MVKEEVTTTQSDQEEVVVREPRIKDPRVVRHKPDTQLVVIAVGASLVLFIIGLILGYLLGHQTAESRSGLNGSMMNGNGRTYQYRTQ